MTEESVLRHKARKAIETGKLPTRGPYRTWAGKGSGAGCAVCGELLAANDIELELEFTGDQADSVGSHYFHMRCFAAWEFEREGAAGCERDFSSTSQYG